MEEKTRVKVVPAEAGRVAMARLQRDTDLVTGIIEVCREAGFEMAASPTDHWQPASCGNFLDPSER